MAVILRAALIAGAALAYAGRAAAQWPDGPYVAAGGRVSFGGEIAATASPDDDGAYFNYTNYELDALRLVRARLLGEWRAARRLSLLGELRIENTAVDAAALFLRWRPWLDRDVHVQIGRIPPVLGAYARRAYGRDNLVIGLPLAYQYLTSLRPDALPATADDLLRMRARGWRPSFSIGSRTISAGLPLVTASQWAPGVEAAWRAGRIELAGAITRGAPAVTPGFDTAGHPAWSGRAALTVAPGVVVGVSGARGRWIGDAVLTSLPDIHRDRDAQGVVAADAEIGLGRVLVRAEWLRVRFDMPAVGRPVIASPLVANTGFVEGRYRWHPRWHVAARVDRLVFSNVQGTLFGGAPTGWDAAVSRVEAVVGYRAARNLELRAGWQHNQREAGRVTVGSYPTAQVLYWF